MSLLAMMLAASLVLQPQEQASDPEPQISPLVAIERVQTEIAQTDQPDDPGDSSVKPALWKMGDADTTIYLFGTLHVLPMTVDMFSDTMVEAMDQSDELVTETRRSWTFSGWLGVLAKAAFDPTLPPLKQRLGAEHHERLDRAVAKSALPASFFDKLQSWAAAGQFDNMVDEAALATSFTGAEEQLETYFDDDDKPHLWLESWREQLGLFSGIDEATGLAMLESSLVRADAETPLFAPMLDAWSSGDIDALTQMVDDRAVLEPGLRESFLYQRNRNWVEWIEKRLEQPGTVFMAVGAAHLVGDKSVIDYLEKAGHTVTRIQ